ncbi:MAG: GxxExxY protein [Verrucomicrobiota bacterium]
MGCAMRVHNGLGPGLREKPYEKALAIEFEESGIQFKQQPCFPIFYHNRPVGDCQPDFLVEDEIVVDCKAIASLGDNEVGQVLNYLRITKKQVGLLLNFKNSSLEQKRVQI